MAKGDPLALRYRVAETVGVPVFPAATDPSRPPSSVAEMRHEELVGWGVRFDLQDKAREKAAAQQRSRSRR